MVSTKSNPIVNCGDRVAFGAVTLRDDADRVTMSGKHITGLSQMSYDFFVERVDPEDPPEYLEVVFKDYRLVIDRDGKEGFTVDGDTATIYYPKTATNSSFQAIVGAVVHRLATEQGAVAIYLTMGTDDDV